MIDIDLTELSDADLDGLGTRFAAEQTRRRDRAVASQSIANIQIQNLAARDGRSVLDPADPPEWIQPENVLDAYPARAFVAHKGKEWAAQEEITMTEPGVAGWTEKDVGEIPDWAQPTGVVDSYWSGSKVTHNGKTWTSTADNNVWEPGVYGWDVKTA